MNTELERLITLQQIDTSIHDAEHRLADEPSRLAALDARIEAARQDVARAKEDAARNQAARRDIEKELAVHQGRLSKFREQSMAVKTNQEYHAIQHEIAFAQNEIRTHEDRMLERMMEADELAGALKAADANLAAEQKAVDAERKAIAAEHDELRQRIDAIRSQRSSVAASLPPDVMAIFDVVSKRRHGVAVAEARDGVCTICHVRLRPQVFNTVRRNDSIVQCDSCQRILYFAPAAPAAAERV